MEVSILFVDDEPQVLRALARTLRNEPYTLAFSQDPLDALARLAERPYDIVVSDFMMPSLTGVELLAQVHERGTATFRMMMTGQADKQATIMAINEGAICHYLEKPWSDVDLKAVLRAAAHSIGAQRAAKTAAPDLAAAARRFGRTQFRGVP